MPSCPYCQAPSKAGKFCLSCGAILPYRARLSDEPPGAPAPAPAPPEPEAGREPRIAVGSTAGPSRGEPKDAGLALLLELLPGILLQTFGIGNLYAGNLITGLLLMFGYWIATVVNVMLCMAWVGFVTWPLTLAATATLASLLAYRKAKETQLAAASQLAPSTSSTSVA